MSLAPEGSAVELLVALLCGYLLGSIPFGLILVKLAGFGDLRTIGSGNIGATNVLRAGSKPLAALTLLLDVLKGTAAVLLGGVIGGDAAAAFAGLGAFLGHIFPAWLAFNGGKGVATYIGVLLGLYWPLGIVFCLVWFAVALATRYSSLSALLASASVPGLFAYLGEPQLAGLFFFFTLLLYGRHEANIRRLLKGEEARIDEPRR
jgi:glycerol-3-phosphate acyltransferase PlsY